MTTLQMEQTQSQQMRQELRQMLRIEQANLLEMPEAEFRRLIAEIEQSALFKKLYQGAKLIRFQRSPRTDIASSFYQLKDEISADRGSLDIDSLLLNKERVVQQIQKVGLDNFKQYFLFPERGMTPEEIAGACHLEIEEVRRINSLVDDFAVMSEFYHPPSTTEGFRYSKIASIETDGDEFIIGYFFASFARGRYLVDYQKFEELAATGNFDPPEVREIRQLFKKLELVNSRKDTMTQILQSIIGKQALYLRSGDSKALLPWSQKELAKEIGLVPSTVSRAIRDKSVDTPWGQELPLKDFFPSPKRFKQELLRRLLEKDDTVTSDEAIRAKLREEFGVAISRRSVAALRKELKLPAVRRQG